MHYPPERITQLIADLDATDSRLEKRELYARYGRELMPGVITDLATQRLRNIVAGRRSKEVETMVSSNGLPTSAPTTVKVASRGGNRADRINFEKWTDSELSQLVDRVREEVVARRDRTDEWMNEEINRIRQQAQQRMATAARLAGLLGGDE